MRLATGLVAAVMLAFAAQAQDSGEVISKQYADGSVYEGTFVNGLQDGTGTYRLPSGFEYTGTWVAGEIVGTGIARYPNGSIYEGAFAKGQPEGKGKMTFADGSSYEGDWTGGKMTGQGRATYANGSMYVGGLLDGKHHRDGVEDDGLNDVVHVAHCIGEMGRCISPAQGLQGHPARGGSR